MTFSGDPSLTRRDVETLLSTINFKPKNIIIDNFAYSPPNHPAGITSDDLGWYYEAPGTSVIIDENATRVYLISNKSIGGPVQIAPSS